MEFIKQFKAARRVSTPLICIRTFDAKSTTARIIESLNGDKDTTPILIWDAMHGIMPTNNTDISKKAAHTILGGTPAEATAILPEALRLAETDDITDLILFLSNAHLQWGSGDRPDPVIIQGIWNLRDSYKANGNMLILLTTPGATLPTELQNDVLVLDEPLPTVEDLQRITRDTYKFAKVEEPAQATVNKATDALIGLPSFSAEQATAMCLDVTVEDKGKKTEKRTGVLGLSDLWDRKRQLINQTPGLSVYSGKETLEDIGGVESAKAFFRAVMEGKNAPKTIIFIDEIEKAFAGTGTDMSGTKTELTGSMLSWMQDRNINGTISIGIPGVSKSALAKAIGGTYGAMVVNFDIAGMQGSLVGQSGANLRAAQKIVDAVSGGSILAIATCNGIASLPPELRRRFSLAQFFFDAPTREEKDIIWKIHRKKQQIPEGQANPGDKGWTGAEIESCCKKAYMLNWSLEQASQYIVPVTLSASDVIAKTRSDANGKYLSASKPGVYKMDETKDEAAVVQSPLAPVFNNPDNAGRKMRD